MSTRKKNRKGWGGTRRGAGRPALPAEERQDAAILLRLKPGELSDLRELASQRGQTIGVYAREILRRHVRRARR